MYGAFSISGPYSPSIQISTACSAAANERPPRVSGGMLRYLAARALDSVQARLHALDEVRRDVVVLAHKVCSARSEKALWRSTARRTFHHHDGLLEDVVVARVHEGKERVKDVLRRGLQLCGNGTQGGQRGLRRLRIHVRYICTVERSVKQVCVQGGVTYLNSATISSQFASVATKRSRESFISLSMRVSSPNARSPQTTTTSAAAQKGSKAQNGRVPNVARIVVTTIEVAKLCTGAFSACGAKGQ